MSSMVHNDDQSIPDNHRHNEVQDASQICLSTNDTDLPDLPDILALSIQNLLDELTTDYEYYTNIFLTAESASEARRLGRPNGTFRFMILCSDGTERQLKSKFYPNAVSSSSGGRRRGEGVIVAVGHDLPIPKVLARSPTRISMLFAPWKGHRDGYVHGVIIRKELDDRASSVSKRKRTDSPSAIPQARTSNLGENRFMVPHDRGRQINSLPPSLPEQRSRPWATPNISGAGHWNVAAPASAPTNNTILLKDIPKHLIPFVQILIRSKDKVDGKLLLKMDKILQGKNDGIRPSQRYLYSLVNTSDLSTPLESKLIHCCYRDRENRPLGVLIVWGGPLKEEMIIGRYPGSERRHFRGWRGSDEQNPLKGFLDEQYEVVKYREGTERLALSMSVTEGWWSPDEASQPRQPGPYTAEDWSPISAESNVVDKAVFQPQNNELSSRLAYPSTTDARNAALPSLMTPIPINQVPPFATRIFAELQVRPAQPPRIVPWQKMMDKDFQASLDIAWKTSDPQQGGSIFGPLEVDINFQDDYAAKNDELPSFTSFRRDQIRGGKFTEAAELMDLIDQRIKLVNAERTGQTNNSGRGFGNGRGRDVNSGGSNWSEAKVVLRKL